MLSIKQQVTSQDSRLQPDVSEGDSNLSAFRDGWNRQHIDQATRFLLDEDERYFLHQSLSTPCLNVLESCKGSYITDLQGRSYLDFHGNSTHQVGFANQAVIRAIGEQLQALSFCTRRYTNIPAIELAKKLVRLAPGRLGKVLFAPGGTTAVGMALKLARAATGRHKTISMWGAFHGASLDTISIGGESLFRRNIGPLLAGTEHVPAPYPYRCMWREDGDCAACNLQCARYVEFVLEQEGDVGAVIAEPIRCTKINPPPEGYWARIRKACDRHGALLIFDETAVGLGRTGKLFACQVSGVEPDILTLGKGLGGGILPLAAIIAREDLNIARDTALGHFTHEKNPVLCAAGLATLEYIEAENLPAKAENLGQVAMTRLRTMQEKFPLIGDIQGQGLLFGAELVTDRKTREPAEKAAEQIMYGCLARGLSFKLSQGNFLTLTPPLTVSRAELDEAFAILEQAFTEVANPLS